MDWNLVFRPTRDFCDTDDGLTGSCKQPPIRQCEIDKGTSSGESIKHFMWIIKYSTGYHPIQDFIMTNFSTHSKIPFSTHSKIWYAGKLSENSLRSNQSRLHYYGTVSLPSEVIKYVSLLRFKHCSGVIFRSVVTRDFKASFQLGDFSRAKRHVIVKIE